MATHGSRRQKLFNQRLQEFLARQPEKERLHLKGEGTGSLAAWFLGPKAENQKFFQKLLTMAVEANCHDRKSYHKSDPPYLTPARKDKSSHHSLREVESKKGNFIPTLIKALRTFVLEESQKMLKKKS